MISEAMRKMAEMISTQLMVSGMSLTFTAWTTQEPRPGMEKTLSTTMAPPIMEANICPVKVMMGRSAFFRACPKITAPSLHPLARAVRT